MSSDFCISLSGYTFLCVGSMHRLTVPKRGTNAYRQSEAQQALQKVSCFFLTVPAKVLGRDLIGQARVT